jgi:hypothetical protein
VVSKTFGMFEFPTGVAILLKDNFIDEHKTCIVFFSRMVEVLLWRNRMVK